MAETGKSTSFFATKETIKQLEELCEQLGENKSKVISRCINIIHCKLEIIIELEKAKNSYSIE
jgi:flagellin-specific chaperone FliS